MKDLVSISICSKSFLCHPIRFYSFIHNRSYGSLVNFFLYYNFFFFFTVSIFRYLLLACRGSVFPSNSSYILESYQILLLIIEFKKIAYVGIIDMQSNHQPKKESFTSSFLVLGPLFNILILLHC